MRSRDLQRLLTGLQCPIPISDYPDRDAGPRRRRAADADADRAHVRARLRQPDPGGAARRRDPRAAGAAGWPSRPIPSSSARSSSPAATSARWRSTARSTTWPCAGRSRWLCRPASSWKRACPWTTCGASCSRCSAAAERAGVPIVTGDTKVVDRGKGDGIFINTSRHRPDPAGHRHLAHACAARRRGADQRRRSPCTASPSCRCARGWSSRRARRATRRR